MNNNHDSGNNVRPRGRLAKVVAFFAMLVLGVLPPVAAQDLSLTASTSSPPPWTTTQPVSVTLTVTNHGTQSAYAELDLEGIDSSGGLVDALGWPTDLQTCFFHLACADFSPPPYDLLFCPRTRTLAPSESVSCTFDVYAHPNANGADIGTFVARTYGADGTAMVDGTPADNRADVLFSYGAASPVPGLRSYAAFLVVLLLAGIGRRDASRRSRQTT